MSGDRDVVLLETVKTHRARLVSALLFGELDERRLVVDNRRRLVVSLVVAAVACAGCAGTSFVLSVLADQRAAQEERDAERAADVTGVPGDGEVAAPAPRTVDPAAVPLALAPALPDPAAPETR